MASMHLSGDPDGTMSAIRQDSPLLNLPAELRSAIYEITCSTIDEASFALEYKSRPPFLTALPQLRTRIHPLERTCRQLRAEFRP